MRLGFRLLRATWLLFRIFASYMMQLALDKVFARRGDRPPWLAARKERVDRKNAKRLLAGMLRLRGVFIKLGQVLSIMGGFLPRAYTEELEQLQDHVPPHPFREVEGSIQRDFGKHPDELFKDFAREPLAAASLGQVHVAHLKSGEKVAVKVLYAGIRDVIRVDMRVLGWGMRVYMWFFPFRNIERVHASLVDLLKRETDYVHEADCMRRMAKNFEGDPGLDFPRPIDELTSGDVLTMTFMEGVKITNFAEFERLGIDRNEVATRFVQSFYKQLFFDRFFHADPHPGNFLVRKDGDATTLVILDFGAISTVEPHLVDGAFEILTAVLTQDQGKVLSGFHKMGFVAEDGNKELLEKTVVTYFQKLLKVKDRSPAALMKANRKQLEKLAKPEVEREELRELMKSFDYPEGWFYVERAAVLAFWLCGQIAPELDAATVGIPYVMPMLVQRQMERELAQASA